jgi:hypothetical protein
VQQALELDDHLVGAAQDHVVDGPLLQLAERHLGGVLQVAVGDLGAVTLDVRPPAPLDRMPRLVAASGDGVEDLGVLGQLPELEAEQPGPLPVDEHHGEAVIGLEDRLQGPHVRGVVDRDLVARRQGRLHHLEEAVGRAGEEGQAPHPGPVEATPHPGGDAVEVGGHGADRLGAEPGGLVPAFTDEVLELCLVVGVAGVAAAVDVEIAAGHHAGAPVAGQRPDPVLADHMAPPPASTYSFSCFMAFWTIMPAAAFFMNPGSGIVMSTART